MIIGAAAQLNSGKDVLCDYLCKELNKNNDIWERAAFANAVKNVFEVNFNVDRNFIEKWKREDSPPPGLALSVRKALQFIGDGFRQIKPDIWIDIAFKDCINKNIIISDCRYINEAKEINKRNGITILMYRDGYLNDDPNPSESQIRPLVEYCISNLDDGPIFHKDDMPLGLENYNYFLNNNGSLNDLYSKIDNLLIPYIEEFFEV